MNVIDLIKRSYLWVPIFLISFVFIFSSDCEGGSISGQVTIDPSGDPIEGVRVTAFNTTTPDYYSNLTDTNGNYSIPDLPAADYYVYTENEQGFINEWYDDAIYCGGRPPFEESTPVTVDADNHIFGIDFALRDTEGSISGRVTDVRTGEPIEGVTVIACFYCCNEALTNATGEYTINGLGTGTYGVRTSNEQDYVDEWYQDKVYVLCNKPNDIELVSVNSPNETSNIDFALQIGGVIRGRVFDDITKEGLENVSVVANFENEVKCVMNNRSTQTDDSGNYEIPGLASGRYVVHTYNATYPTYASFEAYDNAPNFSSDKIKIVEVVEGDSTNDIDFGMPVAQSVSGTISGVDNGTEICIAASSSPISYFLNLVA